ncbi:MAG: KpsF/GutQ family sugar-phosphate isomerase [Desulfobacteraceae bacterium]|nr:KpsF/GutQ family sugar-phosphate isomerase [Desulfobacteraceae bacterium]
MIREHAISVLKVEAAGILGLIDRIDANFEKMVEWIYQGSGRVIVAGIGKSGIIARKIVATLNSTGTRALFLHPVEAMHGDLGMVGADDVFIALSYSGETDELNILLPSIRKIGCRTIAFTGNGASTLASNSDIVIDVYVEKEACPLGLAPTASTTAMLAIGDALAVTLIEKNSFKPSDFKKYHPGGALGQRLSSSVEEMMLTGDSIPMVTAGVSMEAALTELNRLSFGAVFIVDATKKVIGIFTDGDLRRLAAHKALVYETPVDEVMTAGPKQVTMGTPAYDALYLMEKAQITVLPVCNRDGAIQGILHLHDILGKGDFKFNGEQHP